MTSLTGRWSRDRQRAAVVLFTSAVAALVLATPGTAHPEPADTPEPSTDSNLLADPWLFADPDSAPARPDAPARPEGAPVDPGAPQRTERVAAPGNVTCDDLGLGTTLHRVSGASENDVVSEGGVSSIAMDTDADGDGDPDSLYVLVEPGTIAGEIVAFHGDRANIYQGIFGPGEHGPFYAPSRPNNAHPPVTHRLVCGHSQTSSSPADGTGGTDGPDGYGGDYGPPPLESPSPSMSPSESPSPPPTGNGELPVTGLALTGMLLTGLGMVSAGAAMRTVRRRGDHDAPVDL